MGKQLKIPSTYTKVTGFVQAEFHFNNNKLLGLPVTWFHMVYLRKIEENSYELAVIPLFGKARVYDGDAESVKGMLSEYTFCVMGDASLWIEKKPSFLDKIVNSLGTLFSKGAEK